MNQKFEIDGDSPPPKRKQPLLHDDHRRRLGEVAGGATAECAVMCCCIPVAIVNLLILAVYKVPAGLGKKVWRRRKMKKKKRSKMTMMSENLGEKFGGDGTDGSDMFGGGVEFDEDEMWGELYGTGFWRVPSHKQEIGVQL